MAEIDHAAVTATEVYAPRSVQLWRALMNWIDFFFEILLQILRGTPCVPQVLSCIGFTHNRILSSSSSPSFKPLPLVELPLCLEDGVSHADDPLEKLTVVLDLDETLICAYETSSLPSMIRTQATDAGLKWFELECVSSDKECDGKPKISYVTVFERPGLHEFLKQIGEFAVLVLFTAGLEGYARPLVDRIDVENRFSHRLYRPSTVSTFLRQPLNGIPCVPFSAGQPYDDQLLEVLLPLLKNLSRQKDVRPVLHERFHMPEWFQMHGIPSSNFK
ncbi:hypothetical protein F8388_022518 [Cannabis sativa]|uniref:Mitochondrial import inner membrane translocase subunit TIM50 n=1 Tax=Cannabis sativa TaxID=3483 RepID=A0A7J6EK45_CANSA|nr:hypothetical protein F8388_022518 [Cannabis sativa]KAF4401466.1 hypothetical protein G4B88_001660 [Cannabis sativa]